MIFPFRFIPVLPGELQYHPRSSTKHFVAIPLLITAMGSQMDTKPGDSLKAIANGSEVLFVQTTPAFADSKEISTELSVRNFFSHHDNCA
ncbi:hypothetical protein CDAR_194831 [Caerostris darwini]|uniref:Uncharacterized protein n=1 Tax=Caerostris darwini TaxID=1538125 RepID=A0AAV4X9I9_9ARAC|nr:hypothetical protein CDAR_194831 [Caerostris darwini]